MVLPFICCVASSDCISSNMILTYSLIDYVTVSTLRTIVELLIRSHDCFTASCNMEGIASVLRKCQNLANTLQLLKHWALLVYELVKLNVLRNSSTLHKLYFMYQVRLVTGVGRFTEMNYIFQILKENDQFEFLLGQGLDKVCISVS